MRKRLTGEQLFPMVCLHNDVIESLRREACGKCFRFFEDIGVLYELDEAFLSEPYSEYAKDHKDQARRRHLRVRADMALLDELSLDNYNDPPFSLYSGDDLSYELGREYLVYLTRNPLGKYRIRLMPISYYAIMKTVPDIMRQKPYVKRWEKGGKIDEHFSSGGGRVYAVNTDRWDLIGSIRKNGKAVDQVSFGVAPMAYDAYNAALKYIEKSGLPENHTFEETYDITVYLTDMLCGVLERYVAERNLECVTYRRGHPIYKNPKAIQETCRKLIPDGKRLYPMLETAFELRKRLAGYRFYSWGIPNGWGKINNLHRLQIRQLRGQ